jgi:hypothetical protein
MANTSGGTAGKAESGDTITLTYSETMSPASILAGWSGSPTTATVRFANGPGNQSDTLTFYDAANTTQLALGSVSLGDKGYVTAGARFSATMQANGASVVITLGTPTAPASFTVGASGRATWTPSAGATDLIGNPCATTLFRQPLPNRLQF